MTCYHPKVAYWYSPEYQESRPGGYVRPIFISEYQGTHLDYSVPLHINPLYKHCMQQYFIPCGKCEGCRIANMQQWQFRAQCELDEHSVSAFITLTVDDAHIQEVFPGLKIRHGPFQLFMKRFRKAVSPLRVRYMMCGEYGTHTYRPHYHVIVFGWFPRDYILLKREVNYDVFVSDFLRKLWPFGYHSLSLANDKTVRYLVGYVMKKCDAQYPSDAPPYLRVSSRPALGLSFYERYKSELFAKSSDLQFPNSFVYCGSKTLALPRYFIKRYKLDADNVDYVSLMKYRQSKLAERPVLEISDLQRLEDYFKAVTKGSHNLRANEV